VPNLLNKPFMYELFLSYTQFHLSGDPRLTVWEPYLT